MQPTEPIPRAVDITEPAGLAITMARWEANRLHHAYQGPEHLLLGLLRQGDNLAARVLVAHGLDLETVRSEINRLIAQGVLPGPPSDAELRRQQDLQAKWLDAQNLTPQRRAKVERLIAQGVLPGPHLGDAAPLATANAVLTAAAMVVARRRRTVRCIRAVPVPDTRGSSSARNRAKASRVSSSVSISGTPNLRVELMAEHLPAPVQP